AVLELGCESSSPAETTPSVLVPAEMPPVVVPACTPAPIFGLVPNSPVPTAAMPIACVATAAMPASAPMVVLGFGGTDNGAYQQGGGENEPLRHYGSVRHRE